MCQTTCSNSSTYVLLLTCTYSFLLTATYVLLLTYCFLLLPTYCYLHVHTVSYILLPTYCFLDIASYLLLPTDCYLLTASYVLRILHLPDRWFNQFGYFGGYCVHYNGSSMDTLNLHVLSRSLSLSLSLPLSHSPSLSPSLTLSHSPSLILIAMHLFINVFYFMCMKQFSSYKQSIIQITENAFSPSLLTILTIYYSNS